MYQEPLAYMAVFCQASLEPGPSGSVLRTLRAGTPRLPVKGLLKKLKWKRRSYVISFENSLKVNDLEKLSFALRRLIKKT